jgi:hypothetical protein
MSSVLQVYLQSQNCTRNNNGSYNSDLIFLFKSPIVPPAGHNLTLRLVNLYVPISFTIINDTNNFLTVTGYEYYIPSGNYTAENLATTIMDLISVEFPTLTITFETITNKLTFSDTSDFTIGGTILYVLGFSDTAVSSGQTVTSTYPVDLTGINNIYVNVVNLATPCMSSADDGNSSVIRSVLVDVPCGSVLYYESRDNNYYTIQEDHVSFVHLQLLGEDGKTCLNLNAFDWSCTLEVGSTPIQQQPTIAPRFKDVYKNYLEKMKLI